MRFLLRHYMRIGLCRGRVRARVVSSFYRIMAAFPRWSECWSSYNLQSFQIWFQHYATEHEQQSVLELYVVEHRALTPILDSLGLVPVTIPVTLSMRGTSVTLPTQPCRQPGCARCVSGRGGYQFRWIDSRWTPRAALDLSLNPQQAVEAMGRPWPHGMRSIPAGTSRRCSSTSMSSSCTELPSASPQASSPPMPPSEQQPAAYRVRVMHGPRREGDRPDL